MTRDLSFKARLPRLALFTVVLAAMALFAAGCQNVTTPVVDTPAVGIDRGHPEPDRLAGDPRTALLLEAFYALDQGHGGFSSKTLNGNCVGDWAYLTSDMNAYNVVKGWYGSYASVWTIFSSSPSSYAMYGGYGRDGQCRFFINVLTFRSATYQKSFPSYATITNTPSLQKPIDQLQVGDMIQTKTANGHTALVVVVNRDSSGRVISADVIDCNFVGGDGQEIIARHVITRTYAGGVGDLNSYIVMNLPLS